MHFAFGRVRRRIALLQTGFTFHFNVDRLLVYEKRLTDSIFSNNLIVVELIMSASFCKRCIIREYTDNYRCVGEPVDFQGKYKTAYQHECTDCDMRGGNCDRECCCERFSECSQFRKKRPSAKHQLDSK